MADKEDTHNLPTEPGASPETEKAGTPATPEKIGPYKVEALLDKGGMSYLYLGTHPESKEPITIKVLSQKYISNPEVVQRFLNEAEIISMTNHPNIIKMYGHGEWEGGLYIAMEYIEGMSLRKFILKNPISLKRALGIIIDTAYALCHLHTHGVIHRDLKPENILVTEEGAIKVIDFGIAQLMTEKTGLDQPRRQKLIGTPIYISPEQKENPETVSFPSDIYSLGIIAYELILGRPSHGHIHLSLMPTGMQPILHRCLLPDPDKRYQDIVDFITDTSTYLNSPALQKDRQAGDELSELSEELQQMQANLTPAAPPEWKGLEVGISSFKDLRAGGVYYDFFKPSDETYGILIGESPTTGAESFLATACLKGMVRVLYHLAKRPVELVTVLNDLLIQDKVGPIFNLNYLVIHPRENTVTYVSMGYGNLWHVPADGGPPENCSSQQYALGIDPQALIEEKTLEWNVGDVLILNTFSSFESDGNKWEVDEKEFVQAIRNNIAIHPQRQVDHILRKTRVTMDHLPKSRMLTLISLKRTG